MANTVKCRHVTDDEKKLWESLKVDVNAENGSEALRVLLAAYEEHPELVVDAADDAPF